MTRQLYERVERLEAVTGAILEHGVAKSKRGDVDDAIEAALDPDAAGDQEDDDE